MSTSGIKLTKWYEYLIRFGLGGAVRAAAAVLAKRFGPGVDGLFLAFPAILAASATLVEKHERERKEEKGLDGLYRGRHAAGADAAGAAMGRADGLCRLRLETDPRLQLLDRDRRCHVAVGSGFHVFLLDMEEGSPSSPTCEPGCTLAARGRDQKLSLSFESRRPDPRRSSSC